MQAPVRVPGHNVDVAKVAITQVTNTTVAGCELVSDPNCKTEIVILRNGLVGAILRIRGSDRVDQEVLALAADPTEDCCRTVNKNILVIQAIRSGG